MIAMRTLRRFWAGEAGASAVEFVLVLPLLVLVTIGVIYLCMMMYAVQTLHYAVEDAARCRSVKTATCSDSTTTNAYALARYRGPNIGVSFTTSSGKLNCGGYPVTGTGNFQLRTGVRSFSVPLSATACYPTPN